jgi:hypothetical protein
MGEWSGGRSRGGESGSDVGVRCEGGEWRVT